MRCDAPWPHGLGLGQRDLSNELKPQLLELTSALMRSQEISEIDRLGLVGSKISKDAAMPRVHRRLELCPFGFLFFTPPRNHSVIGDWHIFGATYYGCLRLGDGIISRVTRKSLRNQCLAWLVRCCEPAKHHWYFWRSWLRRLKRPIRVVWGCLVPAETVTLESCNMLYYKCPIKHPEIMVQERAAHTRPGKRWQKAIEAMAQSK